MESTYWYLFLIGCGVFLLLVILIYLWIRNGGFQGMKQSFSSTQHMFLRADAYKDYKKHFGQAPPKGTSAQQRRDAVIAGIPIKKSSSLSPSKKRDGRFIPRKKDLRLKRVTATYEPLGAPKSHLNSPKRSKADLRERFLSLQGLQTEIDQQINRVGNQSSKTKQQLLHQKNQVQQKITETKDELNRRFYPKPAAEPKIMKKVNIGRPPRTEGYQPYTGNDGLTYQFYVEKTGSKTVQLIDVVDTNEKSVGMTPREVKARWGWGDEVTLEKMEEY